MSLKWRRRIVRGPGSWNGSDWLDAKFEAFVDALPPGTEVVMEACGTAYYWGRRRCHPFRPPLRSAC